MSPIIHLADLALNTWEQGERYRASSASFGERLGLTQLGIRYYEVPPGKSGCPFHNHFGEDELFVILDGAGTYRFGTDEHVFRAGDVLAAPAGGRETAHQILNTGDSPLRYLGLSGQAAADVVEYPDSGKFLSYATARDGKRFRFIGRQKTEVDYWEDEPGA